MLIWFCCHNCHSKYRATYVVCRAFFGAGHQNILLSNMSCTGTEHELIECRHNGYFNNSCIHRLHDAGVSCTSELRSYILSPYIKGNVAVRDKFRNCWNLIASLHWAHCLVLSLVTFLNLALMYWHIPFNVCICSLPTICSYVQVARKRSQSMLQHIDVPYDSALVLYVLPWYVQSFQ